MSIERLERQAAPTELGELFPSEQQYEVAGWMCLRETIDEVRSRLGPDIKNLPKNEKFVFKLLTKKPNVIKDKLGSWATKGINTSKEVSTFFAIGACDSRGNFNESFVLALEIESGGDAIFNEISELVKFGRHATAIEDCKNFYADVIMAQESLDLNALRDIAAHMQYYIGHYDPFRN